MDRRLFLAQRLSALVLAPLVLVHLGLVIYAIRGGLSAEEILGRTEGSAAWAAFYALFVVAAAIHAPIGLRNILLEWTAMPRRAAGIAAVLAGLALLALGLRAVWIVT
jgi:fumarate reductase subunit C